METELSQEQIKEKAERTAAQFGDFEYLEYAVREHGGPAVSELERVRSVMTDSSYKFVFRTIDKDIVSRLGLYFDFYECKYYLELYKKIGKSYIQVGLAVIYLKNQKPDKYYYLDYLELIPAEQHHGKGAALFLYTLQVIRQLAATTPDVVVKWTAEPPFLSAGPGQEALNRFYERMGGKKVPSGSSFGCDFEWQGLSLMPFFHVMKEKV